MAEDWRPAIRALTYCIQFSPDPTRQQSVDHVIKTVVNQGALGRDRDYYRASVASALASNETLSNLIPQDHPEEVIRRFLELVLARL